MGGVNNVLPYDRSDNNSDIGIHNYVIYYIGIGSVFVIWPTNINPTFALVCGCKSILIIAN